MCIFGNTDDYLKADRSVEESYKNLEKKLFDKYKKNFDFKAFKNEIR